MQTHSRFNRYMNHPMQKTRKTGIGLRWPVYSLLAVIALVLFFGLAAPVLAQEKSVIWDRFDADITVNPDSTVDVTEHQTISFTSGQFTFGRRNIPVEKFSYIDNWALVDGQGNRYELVSGGEQPYTFTVDDQGWQYDLRWNFPSIANDTETYSLSYTVHDALRYYEGGDQVWWNAIYQDRAFPVLEGRVRVQVPERASVQEYAAYINGGDASASATAEVTGDNVVVFDLTRRLNANQGFEVRVEFTPGIVDGAVQPWQAEADAAAAAREAEIAYRQRWEPIATLGFCLLGLLFGVGGLAGLYAIWYKFGRDKPVERVADYLPEPPSSLRPGMAGTLLDERADMEDILATLVDLARRKAISITEDTQEGFFRSRPDFVYRRERTDVELADYESQLLTALFGSSDEVKLSDLKEKFYSKIDGIKKGLYEAVVAEGYFKRSPETVRNQYGCLGIGGIIAAGALAVAMTVLFSDFTSAAIFPGLGLGIFAVGLLVLARYMPRKSPKGAQEAARWEAFRTYLDDIDKYSDLEAQKEIWDQWLPYAIAFGLEKQYMKKFEQVDAPAPGWYIPTPGMYGPYRDWYYGTPGPSPTGPVGGGSGRPPFSLPSGDGPRPGGGLSDMSRGLGTGLAGMSAGMGAMLNSASSTFTSRPASSSSGGGWSSGGGGFSGGGSFGGGGGGGGGGGFG